MLYRKVYIKFISLLLFMYSCFSSSAQQTGDRKANADFRYTLQQFDSSKILFAIDSGKRIIDQNTNGAFDIFYKTLLSSRENNYTKGITLSLIQLGNAYGYTGNYDKAIAMYQAAVAQCLQSRNVHLLFNAYNGIAYVYQVQGNYDIAAKYLFQIISLSEFISSSFKMNAYENLDITYSNLGGLFIEIGQWPKALHYLNKSEQLVLQKSNQKKLASIYTNKGIVYFRQKEWLLGRYYFERSVQVARQYNMIAPRANALINLGAYYNLMDTPQKALTYLIEADTLKAHLDVRERTKLFTTLATTHYQLHNYNKAEQLLYSALKDAEKSKLISTINIYYLLSQIHTATGKYRKAVNDLQTYCHLKDSLGDNEIVNNISQLDIKYKTVQKNKELSDKQLLINMQERRLVRKNILIAGIAIAVLLLIMLFVIIYRSYKHKQRLQANEIQILQQEKEISQLKAMMQGEEKERTRIAQDLHDGIGGMLAAINMNFNVAERNMFVNKQELVQIMQMVGATTEEIRKISHHLMPSTLLHHSLADALEQYCKQINIDNQLHIDLKINSDLQKLDKSFELVLYRIVQELIQNIVKHAKATHAIIEVEQVGDILALMVEDNGIGFDTSTKSNGFGIQNLYFRVKALRGDITIQSVKEEGTSVNISFDIRKIRAANMIGAD